MGYRRQGTTSACAENTHAPALAKKFLRNYLRVRGEYWVAVSTSRGRPELPPRARRIPSDTDCDNMPQGTTSACAENTLKFKVFPYSKRNYLRVRGEYHKHQNLTHTSEELPPRARRIRRRAGALEELFGTTSACAENTKPVKARHSHPWNYLRVRGEYLLSLYMIEYGMELPPRARRIPQTKYQQNYNPGTTSACAENTLNELGLL